MARRFDIDHPQAFPAIEILSAHRRRHRVPGLPWSRPTYPSGALQRILFKYQRQGRMDFVDHCSEIEPLDCLLSDPDGQALFMRILEKRHSEGAPSPFNQATFLFHGPYGGDGAVEYMVGLMTHPTLLSMPQWQNLCLCWVMNNGFTEVLDAVAGIASYPKVDMVALVAESRRLHIKIGTLEMFDYCSATGFLDPWSIPPDRWIREVDSMTVLEPKTAGAFLQWLIIGPLPDSPFLNRVVRNIRKRKTIVVDDHSNHLQTNIIPNLPSPQRELGIKTLILIGGTRLLGSSVEAVAAVALNPDVWDVSFHLLWNDFEEAGSSMRMNAPPSVPTSPKTSKRLSRGSSCSNSQCDGSRERPER
ncbi:hypothetical protein HKX48_005682 [Thoreauomyces humboldtii]|nr:hypothetical protein HKX48_005682 [Thoreauomyces humboldtii]